MQKAEEIRKELQPIHIQDFYSSMLNNNLSSNTVMQLFVNH